MRSKLFLCAALAAGILFSGAAPGKYLPCGYYDEETFRRSVTLAEAYPREGKLCAGVVPHHLLAGEMIASFFASAAEDGPYDTVLFVGPSHYPTGAGAVTTRSGWQTVFGPVENDLSLTASLLGDRTLAARTDDENMRLDHAVSGLIPYVGYYLPGAKVSALLLENGLSPERIQAAAERAAAAVSEEGKRVLLVCSIDFSHYLMPKEAVLRDEETRKAVEAFDYRTISRFTDSNMDSPQTMTVFLRTAQARGTGEVTMFDHSSSDRILEAASSDPAYREGTTTYFIFAALVSCDYWGSEFPDKTGQSPEL